MPTPVPPPPTQVAPIDPTAAVGAQLALARSRAAEKGITLDPSAEEAFVREETGGKFGVKDLQLVSNPAPTGDKPSFVGPDWSGYALHGANGIFQHWAPEVGAFLSRIGVPSGGRTPDETAQFLRDQLSSFKATHKVGATAADIAGGVAPFLLAPEIGASTAAGRAAVGAGTGAVLGAVNGAGAAGPDNRVSGAATGGAGGAVLGGTLSPVLGAIADKIAGRVPLTSAEQRLATVAAKDPSWQTTLAKLQAAGRGDQATLADLSPPLAAEADRVATANSDAHAAIDAVTRSRAAGQGDRLLNDVQNVTGNPIADQRLDELAASRRAWANDAYDKLREANKDIDWTSLAATLQKPGVKQAWQQARLAGDIVSDSPADRLFQSLSEQNPEADAGTIRDAMKTVPSLQSMIEKGGTRPATFADLQSFDQMLDGRISTAYRAGNGNLAKAYQTVQSAVKDALGKDPNYAPVQAEYAQRKGLEEAVEAGVEAWGKSDTRALAKQMAAFSPAEQAEFRRGMASQLIDQLRSTSTNRNQAAQLMSASPATQDKLQIVFGDQPTFQKFVQQVESEAQLARLQKATGGSPTAPRTEAGAASVAAAMPKMLRFARSPLMSTLGLVNSAARQSAADAVRTDAGKIAPMLMTQGPDAINQLLARLQMPQPGLPGAALGAPAAAGGQFPGLLHEPQ
ncbi:MAG TPA: hypothetical protein VFA81_04030 [Burkholderiales bacterium]|nr:hypothetical protein [Burkholderiales bacterium]